MAYSLKALGKDSVFLVTDLGQKNWPRPVDGMIDFIAAMLDLGVEPDALRYMVFNNPKRILGEL